MRHPGRSPWLFSVLSAFSVAACLAAGDAPSSGKLPVVSLESLDGSQVKVDFAASKVTLINFWAVWCMPCREEIPDIARLVSAYKGRGLQAFGIAMESGDAAEVKAFLDRHKEFGVNYPMLMGTDEAADAYGGVMAVPTTYLVDSTGRVLARHLGATSNFRKTMAAQIEQALAGAAPGQKGSAAP